MFSKRVTCRRARPEPSSPFPVEIVPMSNPTKLRGAVLTVLAVAVLSSSGCGWFRAKTGYENSPENRPLEVPPDLDRPTVDPTMQVPAVAGGRDTVAPGGSRPVALPSQAFVVADTPDSVWKRLGLALQRIEGVSIGDSAQLLSVYNVNYDGENFLIRIAPSGEGTRISAVTSDGRELDRGAGAKLLGLLRQRLG